ncbi:MAG TPA: hypothetical protein VFZ97_18335 [Acidimicrobiales bacterium]
MNKSDRFLLQHQIFEVGVRDSNWTKSFSTLAEAQAEADQYWPGPDHNVRQVISDLETGEELVRCLDRTWAASRPHPPPFAPAGWS